MEFLKGTAPFEYQQHDDPTHHSGDEPEKETKGTL